MQSVSVKLNILIFNDYIPTWYYKQFDIYIIYGESQLCKKLIYICIYSFRLINLDNLANIVVIFSFSSENICIKVNACLYKI